MPVTLVQTGLESQVPILQINEYILGSVLLCVSETSLLQVPLCQLCVVQTLPFLQCERDFYIHHTDWPWDTKCPI